MRDVQWPYGWGRVDYSLPEREKWMRLPFTLDEYAQRIERCRTAMQDARLDAVIMHGIKGAERAAIRYFTNFEAYYKGETFFVLPFNGEIALATDSVMHSEPMHSGIVETWVRDVRAAPNPRTVEVPTTTVYDHVQDIMTERKLTTGRIGTVGVYSRSAFDELKRRMPDIEIVSANELVGHLMMRKSDAEVELMRAVAAMGDAGMEALMKAAVDGVTEHDIAAEAMYAMFKMGAEDTASTMASCAGPRSGLKHAGPSRRPLRNGDMVFTDMCGRYAGYCSDSARGGVVGGAATKEQKRFLEAQFKMIDESIAIARPGVKIDELFKVTERVALSYGYEDMFYFRGHGIGPDTHIPPSFVPGSQAVLEKNMVFAYEPMLIRSDFGTACVEDMYLVTENGCECLSKLTRVFWE